MQYLKVYADELKAQGKTVEIFDVDYGILSTSARDKWFELRRQHAPDWIPDNDKQTSDIFIENESWIKSVKDLKTGTVYSLEEFKAAFTNQIK